MQHGNRTDLVDTVYLGVMQHFVGRGGVVPQWWWRGGGVVVRWLIFEWIFFAS